MSIFGNKKKIKVNVKKPECACHTNCPTSEVNVNELSLDKENEKINLKILGSGCKNCHTLYENTKSAVASMSLKAEIEYITDMQSIMSYGVMSMPALVLNEKVISMGKVYKSEEIVKLLNQILKK